MEPIDGRNILLIGNGMPSDEPDADIVVRINWGAAHAPCDVWIDNEHKVVAPCCEPELIVRLGPRQRATPYSAFNTSMKLYKRMCDEMDLLRPSSGIMAVWWILNENSPQSLTVSGFSGDSNIHTNRVNMDCHDWERERILLSEWASRSLLRIATPQ